MQRVIVYIAFFCIVLISCNERKTYLKKPFVDSKGKYIGDSFFVNNLIRKIVFVDSSYFIDSIVFNRYENFAKTLKDIRTFRMGKNIFENIDYFENGNIKKYSFIDEDNKDYFYERNYDNTGRLSSTKGYLFFQGYITNINTDNLEVRKGVSIDYKIYYPNPPDCKVNLYIKYDDGTKHDVFKKSKFLNFLQTVYQDNNELGTFKTNILLELKDKNTDSILRYNNELIYKVVGNVSK